MAYGNGNEVDRMIANAVQGIAEVGYFDANDMAEVGAVIARQAAQKGMVPGTAGPSPQFGRTVAQILRRAPLGFPSFTLAAAIGATNSQSAKVSRKFHPDRLLIVPSAAGIVVDSVKVGDEEQLLTPGVPVELYGTLALTDSLPDNFTPVPSGIDVSITLRNTTAGALTALCGMKGGVER